MRAPKQLVRKSAGLALAGVLLAGGLVACGSKKDPNGGAAKPAQGGAAVNDQPAEEISEVPSFKDDYSDEDHAYLDDLKDKGIDPKGIEAQLIGTASEVCRAKDAGEESFLVEPIAGQLVELGHTDLSLEDARTVITQAAQRAYC